ncbi:hypothetical protein BCM20_005705 [Clostridium beijerinckii]|nr:hypothetical protein [Clostridium beijerinckii]NOW02486.1 hypothetical protein [Clostridium beijerinckii]NYC05609.1 hypothetical protein [Clostridium beijerinckii]
MKTLLVNETNVKILNKQNDKEVLFNEHIWEKE